MRTCGSFQELNNVNNCRDPTTLTFTAKDFRLIRIPLRLLSLWRPRTASFCESYIYPAIINLILLSAGLIRNIIQATDKPTTLNIQSVYVVHEFGVWLGHILGNVYFRSRDLEKNVLPQIQAETRKPLKRRLKFLNAGVIISMLLFTLMLCTVFVVTQFRLNHGTKRFSSDLLKIHGTLDHIFYAIVIISIVYYLGIGLALAWTMALLYVCFASRLKSLEVVYLCWKEPMVDAVYLFQQVYARPVKRSWKQISWWFLAHNIIALAIPLYGYELAQAFSGAEYHTRHLEQFICYFVFVLVLWLAPLFMAEQIKRREKKFQERVNDICPGLLREIQDSRDASPAAANNARPRETSPLVSRPEEHGCEHDANYSEFTFVSRGRELRDFLRFLKKRRPGLVSHGYSFQLNLSLISLFCGLVSFLFKLHTQDNVDFINMNRNSNETFF